MVNREIAAERLRRYGDFVGARLSEPFRSLRRAVREPGREREAVTQAAKMALAAVLSWAIARTLPSPQSFMAPYAAIFMMAETVYRSLAAAVRQAAAVVIGVLLAYLLAKMIGVPMIAVGIAVLAGVLIGQWNRLADSGIWIAVTALLLLTYSAAEQESYLLYRVIDTVLGAAIGVAVNTLILPPVHLRRTRHAVAEISDELGRLLRSMADDLRGDWDESTARSWLSRATSLDQTVRRARITTDLGRESTRFNLRWMLLHRGGGDQPADFEQPIGTLGEVAEQVRRIADALITAADTDTGRPEDEPESYELLASALDAMAGAVTTFREPFTDASRDCFADQIDQLRDRHRELTETGIARPEVDGAIRLAVRHSARSLGDRA